MADDNKIKYGLKNVYYAKATFDENGYPEYDPPVHIPGAINLALDAEGESEPWYADNMVYTVLNGNAGYSGDLEIALIPESFARDILNEEVDDNGLIAERADIEIEHFALLFQFEGDRNATRHVLYNCTCSRPSIESATTEDTKEPQTDTLQLKAIPLANGYVKGKTCSTTPDGIYKCFFDEVLMPEGAREPHTVYFYDGDTLLQAVHDVPYGGSAEYSGSTPSKEGYDFIGWDPEPTNIVRDTYCYAQYEIKTYTVYFYNGDTLLQTVTDVPYGSSASYTGETPVSPVDPDLRFLGWDPEPTNITKDTKCYAQFEAQTFTVYFYNGDTLLQTVTGIAYGGSATYTGSTPEKEGYTFTGWDPEPINITKDTKCYAQFEAQTFTVYFYNGDTLLQTVSGISYGGSAAYTGKEPEKEGYTFTGWDPEPINITKDTKCYAQFEIKTFTVYFYDGEDLLQAVTGVPYGGSASYTGDTPEKEGYTFTGWDPEPVNITEDTICYAQFASFAAFAVFSEDDSALIFYSDSSAPDVDSTYKGRKVTNVYTGVEETKTSAQSMPWYDIRSDVEAVSFDESFSVVRPIRTEYWFRSFTNCKSIDLTNLNTSECQNMSFMFYYCSSLTELDLSPLDSSSVTEIQGMFGSCTKLTELDISMLDTSQVTIMSFVFDGCSNLVTIYSDDDVFVTDRVLSSTDMFLRCSKLVGGAGTKYDSDNITADMAHVDRQNKPGYFTAK